MQVNVIVVDTGETYKGKDGKDHKQINYYLELQNGGWIAIKPSFVEGYRELNLIAEKRGKDNLPF